MANPNPSPETRFKPGQSGNPSGRSKEELEALHQSAKIAANLTLKALSSLQEKIDSNEKLSEEDLALLFSPDIRGMIKEAQDRAHGTPRQAVDHTTNGKDMPPASPIDKALAEALAKKLTE